MKKIRNTNKIAETFNASILLFDRLEKYLSSSFSPALTLASVSSTLSSILSHVTHLYATQVSILHNFYKTHPPTIFIPYLRTRSSCSWRMVARRPNIWPMSTIWLSICDTASARDSV